MARDEYHFFIYDHALRQSITLILFGVVWLGANKVRFPGLLSDNCIRQSRNKLSREMTSFSHSYQAPCSLASYFYGAVMFWDA